MVCQGHPGDVGMLGLQGEDGPKGSRGPRGPEGPPGDRGGPVSVLLVKSGERWQQRQWIIKTILFRYHLLD